MTVTKPVLALIEQLFESAQENPSGDCDECSHNHCWEERHPYGDTTASERLCECNCREARLCPYVESMLSAALAECNRKEKAP